MFPSTLLIELICFLAAVRYLRKDKDIHWYALIWFMLATTLLDGAGWVIAVFFKRHNHWVYNIEQPVEVFFIGWLFYKLYTGSFHKTLWLSAAAVLYTFIFLSEGYLYNYEIYIDLSDSLAAVIFVIASGLFFFQLLQAESFVDLTTHPPFWLVTGIFLFYFVSTAINIFFTELMEINIAKGIYLRYIILTVLNGILYGSWIIAFRWKYRQTKLSS
ncbi:hypothetical protein Q4E93_20515 [Flavitalea sp. BT771]|uniref:hypothetical protein n=1 Tax=Flavitalea sp. BT771 TaxID=3063329 RepID=UPI0026E3EB85|nr:hypothetical protein [Flavitalea sp. BT771]MDO6433003.1 hypothetical protein [Flavitalea sp. BT771]MDV6221721.1 hypothetical protein [Flavitalea sp. BT771]